MDAARDGDRIVVVAGQAYSGFVIDNKSLSIFGSGTFDTEVNGALRATTVARNLARGKRVLIENIRFNREHDIVATNCVGRICFRLM